MKVAPNVFNLVTCGFVTEEQDRYARALVGRSIVGLRQLIRQARVRITRHSRSGPIVVVQVNRIVAERLIRAQAAASTVSAAVDSAAARLRDLLAVIGGHLAVEEAGYLPYVGQRGRLACSPLPPCSCLPGLAGSDSRLVRSKNVPLAVQPVAATALTMELRDYDVHLVIEEGTEMDSVVYRGGWGGYGLIRTAEVRPQDGGVPSAVRPRSALSLSVPEAIVRVNRTPSDRFVFFVDALSGRGRVIYRRYDGHLGLIIPLLF
ncbi:sigma 54 modulation/S30EA ribosomal C-terminal domain-containing protein [Actinoplanes sp. NPDC049316]|uniref:sigma 54 modulation/S30EA ribosomal C-terminal domain-containing protein n=1 Tax=Actinoplanes sp. NPDC049316 TaxID=3154727 RepID=UPI003414811F